MKLINGIQSFGVLGSCGKTSLQLIKGRKSLTELVPFGEIVMFKIPKTSQAVGSFEERWETGVLDGDDNSGWNVIDWNTDRSLQSGDDQT